MSRINILATFKIRSLTDSYFLVGTSETGDFTRNLGTGEQLYAGDITPLLEVGANGLPVNDGKTLLANHIEDGVSVSVPVSLGEEFGDFIIRLYAENEFGIRSSFVEIEQNILPADISGTFRFQSLDVGEIESAKPSYRSSVKRRAKKTSNLYIKESEFIGKSFQLQFSLKANARLAGNKAGRVSPSNPMFSHFEVEFYQSWDGTTADDSGLTTKLNIPNDWLYSEERLGNYTDFSIYLNKQSIVDLYRHNNIADQDREIILKIVGYDVFYNIDLDANGDPKDDHKFTAISVLENDKPRLDSADFDLFGQSLEVSVQSSDPDLDHGQIKLLKYRSDASGGTYSLQSSERVLVRSITTAIQEWHSDTHPNYYKYIIEVHDSYGFGSFYAVSNGRIKRDVSGHKEFLTEETALAETQVWSSYLQIRNLRVVESGVTQGENKGAFNVNWEIEDSSGNTVDITKDLDGNVAYKIKSNYTVNIVEGFTASLVCPGDYTDDPSSFPIRDAQDLDYLIPSSGGAINGEPIDATVGSSTIDKDGVKIKAQNKLQVFSESSFVLTRGQNQNLYRSWFNDLNKNKRRSVDGTFDKVLHDPFRVVYDASYGGTITDYDDASKERHVDAQRKVKVRVELINKNSETVHLIESTGYNAPPVFQLGGSRENSATNTQSLNDQGNSKNDNTSGGSNHSAVDVQAGQARFELPPNERIQYVEIFRRPHVKPDLDAAGSETDPITCYSEVFQDNSNPQQGGHFYNKQSTDFYVLPDDDNSQQKMLFNYGINPDNGEQQYGGGDGFYVRRVSSLGNSSKQPIVNGINIGSTENNTSYQDFPPMLCENGLAKDTVYDYLIVPFDLFGSGQAEFFEDVKPVSPHRYSQDERGAIGTLDFDAPSEPVGLRIGGANKTFQLNWGAPIGTSDLDYYNLYYILDNRDHTQMFHGLQGSDPITKGTNTTGGNVQEDIINFSTEGYVYGESDFLEQDFNFKDATNADIAYFDTNATYSSGDLVQYKPSIPGTNDAASRLYMATTATAAGESPGSASTKWQLQPNVTIYDDRNIIYKDEIIDRVRTDTVLNNGTGSHTYNLIYYSAVKTYSVEQVVFFSNKCYKSLTDGNKGNEPSVGGSAHWKLVPDVEIIEVHVPSNETSISVQGDSNARGYFYLESVDRAGNRSRLHADPMAPGSKQVKKDLGKPTIRDVENFEQDLSSEFPHALMLRPDDPFTITGSTLSWHGHYLYSAGQGYFIAAGSMDLEEELFASNASRDLDSVGGPFSSDRTDPEASQFIRHIYFDRAYGFNTNHATSDRFSTHQVFAGTKTIRDIESDQGHGSDSSDSGIEEKDRDTKIQYSGYYLFCTGNPASNTYNVLKDDGTEAISLSSSAISGGDIVDGDRISVLNAIIDDFKTPATPDTPGNTSIRIVPKGQEPTVGNPNQNGLGTWGMHIQKSSQLKTDSSDSLFSKDENNPGTFQILRIDRVPDGSGGFEYFKEVNFETFNNATIGQANIANATITSAQVADLSADVITAGMIGSHKIEIGNSIKPVRNGGVMSDEQKYMHRKKNPGANFDVADGKKFITQDEFDLLGTAHQALFFDMTEEVYFEGGNPFSVVGSQYEYGSITSKDFGHDTMGRPGFYISGDGQFGFQTTRGGLYLRDDGTGTPAELVLRGTLVQEDADPFVKIEMSATSQFVSFDEHAANHYYTGSTDSAVPDPLTVYGTQTQIISPSDGRITIEYSIQNARHVDGSPYTANELELRIYPDGDIAKAVNIDEVVQLVGNQTLAHERKAWASGGSYDQGEIVKHNEKSWVSSAGSNTSEPNASSASWTESDHYQNHDHYISDKAFGSLTAEEQQAYGPYQAISDNRMGIMGLNDLSDINEGGSITLDFLGGKDATPLLDGLNKERILFTGQPITTLNDNILDNNDVARDTLAEIRDELEELDILDVNEGLTVPNKLIPVADSYTVEFMIKPRTPAWSSSRTYLAGDLAKYNGVVFRALQVHSSDTSGQIDFSWDTSDSYSAITDEFNAMIASLDSDASSATFGSYLMGQGDYWRIIPNEFSLDRKKLTITRKDKPANLASVILTSDEGNVIRNGENDATINIYPKLKYGTEEYDLNAPVVGLDWVESMREQLAIYEGPPTIDDGHNEPQTTHFKLRKQWQNNSFTYGVSDSVVDGKSTFFLVDRRVNYTFDPSISIDDWGQDIIDGKIKILDEFEVVDLNDGKPAILVETVNADDQFITRLLDTKVAAHDGSALGHTERHKLQPLSKAIDCKVSVYAPTGTGKSLNTYTHDFKLLISNVARGSYATASDVSLVSSDGQTIYANSAGSGQVFEVKDGSRVIGKARLDLDFDNSLHVSEIEIRARLLQTYNRTVESDNSTVDDKADSVSTGSGGPNRWGLDDVLDGVSEVYINTAEPIDHAIRLNLLRKMITYSRQYEKIGDLDRAENIVPMQIFLGTENVSDEFHEDATASSNTQFELIPSEGYVVDAAFLNGANTGNCYPNSGKTEARKLIERYTVGAPVSGSSKPLVYHQGSKWFFFESSVYVHVQNGSIITESQWNALPDADPSDGSDWQGNYNNYIDTTQDIGKEYMYYIPVSQSRIGADKIKIKTTYTKVGQPLARIDVGDNTPNRTYTDTEELPVVEINNGSSTVTLFTDNLNAEIPITSEGATEVIVTVDSLTSTIEAYIGLDRACLAPTYIKINGTDFTLDNTIGAANENKDKIRWNADTAISSYTSLGCYYDTYGYSLDIRNYVREMSSTYEGGGSMESTITKRTDDDIPADQDVKYICLSEPSEQPSLPEGFHLALFNAGHQLVAYAEMPEPMKHGIFIANTGDVVPGIRKYTTQQAGEGGHAGTNLTSVLGLVPTVPNDPDLDNIPDADVFKVSHKVLYDYVNSEYGNHSQKSIDAAITFFKDGTSSNEKYFDFESQISIPIDITVYDTKDYWKTDGAQSETVNKIITARKSGPTGATTTYRGTWKADETYFGTKERRDIVYYDGDYWLAREGAEEFAWGEDIITRKTNNRTVRSVTYPNGNYGLGFTSEIYEGTYPPGSNENDTNDSFVPSGSSKIWAEFGAQFESVSTNLLLADDVFVKRGIVTGKDDPYQGFVASQLSDSSFTPGAGGIKVDLNSSIGGSYPVAVIDPGTSSGYDDREANANQAALRNITEVNGVTLQYFIDPNDPDNTDKFSSTTAQGLDPKPHVTTWKIPYVREPGFYLGYHDLRLCPDGIFNDPNNPITYADGSTFNVPNALPMLELYSPTGNFVRWNGLRLELFGSVINGSINDSGTISIGVGTDHAINHVGFSNDKLLGGQIFCGGGVANYITDTKDNLCSTITGGAHNSLFGKFSFIGSGYGNYILDNDFSFIGSGFANGILNTDGKTDSFNAILSGRANKIVNSDHGVIGTGFGNVISKSDYGSILNGQGNVIGSGDVSTQAWKDQTLGNNAANDTYGMNPASGAGHLPASPWSSEVIVDISRDYRARLIQSNYFAEWNSAYPSTHAWYGNLWGTHEAYQMANTATSPMYKQMILELVNGAQRASLTFPTDAWLADYSDPNKDPYLEAGDHPYAAFNPFIQLTLPASQNRLPLVLKWRVANGGRATTPIYRCDSFNIASQNGDTKDIYLVPLCAPVGCYWLGQIPIEEIETEHLGYYDGLPNLQQYVDIGSSDLNGYLVYIDRNFFPWMYVYSKAANGGEWMLLKVGLEDRLRVVALESVSKAWRDGKKSLPDAGENWGDATLPAYPAPNSGRMYTIAEAQDAALSIRDNVASVEGETWTKTTTARAQLGNWASGIDNTAKTLSTMKRMLSLVDLGDSDNPTQLFSHNSIIGGKGNSIHNSKNSLIVASTSTSLSGLKNAVVGGAGNIVDNEGGSSLSLYSAVSALGSSNTIAWADSASNKDAQLTVLGSDNVLYNTTSSVFLGNANKVIGSSETSSDNYNNTGNVVALNIFGNNNELVGNYSANTCAIFGSNFKLTTVEQMQNAFYFGNPYLAGSSTDALTRLFFAADGGAYFTGDVISFALSDEKYKENISLISEPMNKVKKLRGVAFDWKDNQSIYSGRDVGLIAQEVELVLPEVVSSRESGSKAVKYEKIVPLLVECIKSLGEKIESLESTINELKKNS